MIAGYEHPEVSSYTSFFDIPVSVNKKKVSEWDYTDPFSSAFISEIACNALFLWT